MTSLPIDHCIPEIKERFLICQNLILTAEPGTGKTTRLPYQLLSSSFQKIAVLEPRRLAAVGAASRVCEEQGLNLGSEVGYQVRGDTRAGPQTRLIYMTEAILLRRMISDPELSEFELIIIDEFHERNLNQELLMGLIRELQEMGSQLKVLTMSATLDAQPLLDFWPNSQSIDIPGKLFPLEFKYISRPQRLKTDHRFFESLCQSIEKAYEQSKGDILVFLPGKAEIHRCQNQIHPKIETLALYGSMKLGDQKKIFDPHPTKRVILATNIAEASITIPGVRWVIDSGLEKKSDFNFASGFSRLNLQRISLFSATQRAGRAARTGPGVCQRLWNPKEEEGFSEQSLSEIRRSDLSAAFLYLYALGVPNAKDFSWFENPTASQVKLANNHLMSLGAIDKDCKITSEGEMLLSYPVSLRLGKLLIEAKKHDIEGQAALACVLIEEPDLVRPDDETQTQCDIIARLKRLGKQTSSKDQVYQKASTITQLHSKKLPPIDIETIKKCLLISHTDRVCRKRKGKPLALMVGGRGVELEIGSRAQESEFFIALAGIDLPQRANTKVTLACGIDREFILTHLEHKLERTEEIQFENDRFYKRSYLSLLGLPVEDPVSEVITPSEEMLQKELSRIWPKLLKQNEELKQFFQRLTFTEKSTQTKIWNKETEQQLITYACFGKASWDALIKQDFALLAQSLLPQDDMIQIKQYAPTHFTAPSESSFKIDYTQPDRPIVRCKVQELYGLKHHPTVGRPPIPICFELLAPNFRPTQITSDILSFWQTSYHEVRKDLRSRYPKHFWPEDPLAAEAKKRR